jgi:hypothetical protein
MRTPHGPPWPTTPPPAFEGKSALTAAQRPDPATVFRVAQDGTLHFTVRARNVDDAWAQVSDFEATEARVETLLDDGVHLTHITYGKVWDTDITDAGDNPTARRASGPDAATARRYSDALRSLTARLAPGESSDPYAGVPQRILEPATDLLEQLAEILAAVETAATATGRHGIDADSPSPVLARAAAVMGTIAQQLRVADAAVSGASSQRPHPARDVPPGSRRGRR